MSFCSLPIRPGEAGLNYPTYTVQLLLENIALLRKQRGRNVMKTVEWRRRWAETDRRVTKTRERLGENSQMRQTVM